MAVRERSSDPLSSGPDDRSGNLGATERWLSLLSGLGLLLTTARGGAIGRVARGAAGLSLLARGASGHCAIKAVLRGDGSVSDGLKEQWRRLTSRAEHVIGDLGDLNDSGRLDSMDAMYEAELQELHNAEGQLCQLANDLARTMSHPELAFRLQEYATELQSRRVDLESLLARINASLRDEPDDAMIALIGETEKMWRVCAANVRDAAVTASLQRIIHYKIAGYGTIAAYAKSLARLDEAAHFAQLADRDKAVDAELSELARGTLNPDATVAPSEPVSHEQAAAPRPH
jgi:ferritin-like metal-binding protein YciE